LRIRAPVLPVLPVLPVACVLDAHVHVHVHVHVVQGKLALVFRDESTDEEHIIVDINAVLTPYEKHHAVEVSDTIR